MNAPDISHGDVIRWSLQQGNREVGCQSELRHAYERIEPAILFGLILLPMRPARFCANRPKLN